MNVVYNCKILYKLMKNIRQKSTKVSTLGKNIAILGNGPSNRIFKEHYEEFKDYDLCVVNFYPIKSDDFFTFKPRYLCMIDPGLFNIETKREVVGDIKELANDVNNLMDVLNKVDWKLNIIVQGNKEMPIHNNNITYIRLAGANDDKFKSKFSLWLYKKNRLVMSSQNVINFAISFAEIFGYSKIALFGLEQNFLQTLVVDESNNLYFDVQHFYKNKALELKASYLSEIKDVVNSLEEFKKEAEIAEMLGIDICNYTPNSYVQYFRKEVL